LYPPCIYIIVILYIALIGVNLIDSVRTLGIFLYQNLLNACDTNNFHKDSPGTVIFL